MLDDFIRRNKVELITIILCVLIIATEICAMTIIGFEWQLLVILLPFPILIVGNVLAIFKNKKNIGVMITIKIMQIVFAILIIETGAITIFKSIYVTGIMEVTNKVETIYNILIIMCMVESILATIVILMLMCSKVEDDKKQRYTEDVQ